LNEFASIEQNWTIASAMSVGNNNWTYFSAACWFFGRDLNTKYKIPIGLVSTNWGGTIVQAWSSPDALAQCNQTDIPKGFRVQSIPFGEKKYAGPNPNQPSVLWNAMIVPLLPMRVRGAI